MSTVLTYLNDTYLAISTATVLSIETTEHGTALVLDATIFYPQGGGQPTDTGTIESEKAVFTVTMVRLQPDGTVFHYGEFSAGELEAGQTAELNINLERRLLNSRIHTAGHLVDIAVRQAGIEGLTPTKGFHTPEGAYVEYQGTLEEASQYIEALQKVSNQLVKQDSAIHIEDLDSEQAQQMGIQAPPGKSARFVYFAGFKNQGCGCGGTHVGSTAEIGAITIRKIKCKKGITRISYAVV